MTENTRQGHLHFTTELKEALLVCEICFIAVGTPMGEDGSADLRYVLDVAKSIGTCMCRHMYIVDKSTVPVGTAGKVREKIQQQLDLRKEKLTFDVISNPEFLKEGTAVSDCLKPDRIVIGTDNDHAADVMTELYKPYMINTENFILMDIASAEMTKYAANSMLAAKISFMNEMSGICERVGADINKVRRGIGSDRRIGYSFIYPGCGYGGSCFPKDVQALIKTADACGYTAKILQAVEQVNRQQKHVLAQKVIHRFGEDLSRKSFAVWGLAFKPDTDDMRESAAITIIQDLTNKGAAIRVYDPKAMAQAQDCYLKDNGQVVYCDNKYDALNDTDALILVTEWKEFRSPDFYEIKNRMKTGVIFDGRNQYNRKSVNKFGMEYYQIGVRAEEACGIQSGQNVCEDRDPQKENGNLIYICSGSGFYWIMNRISDSEIAEGARDFRLMKKEMADAVVAMGEYNRFSKGIFGWIGFRTYWMPYDNVKRLAGKSKWNFWKLFRYAVDGIINFSHVPLNLSSLFGSVMTFAAFILLMVIVIRRICFGDPVAGWASMICAVIFMGGMQLFCIGIMGQYVAKIYMESKHRPHYIIAESSRDGIKKIQ